MSYNFFDLKDKSKKVEEWLRKELSVIRTGRATPSILDSILVESYGAKMPINQVAGVFIEDPKTLRVSPWDSSVVKSIEKAVISSSLGLSVVVDDNGLRVIFPDLTAERRESLKKIARQKLEEAKISLRTERERVWNDIQSKEKEGQVSEDEKFKLKDEMQKIIDDINKGLEAMAENKIKDISS